MRSFSNRVIKKINKSTLMVAAAMFLFSGSVNATPITDVVSVGGKEWAQLNLFTGLSWNDINAQCPSGVCGAASTLNGYDMGGWAWASVDEVGDLFNSVTPHPGGIAAYSESASVWAPQFFDVYGFEPTLSVLSLRSVQGWSSTVDPSNAGIAYRPEVVDGSSIVSADVAVTTTASDKSLPSANSGAWFFRNAVPTPEPTTAGLLTLAVGVLGWRRRRPG